VTDTSKSERELWLELRLELDDGTDVAAALHRPRRAEPSDVAARSCPPVLLLPGARGDHAAAHLVALAEVLAGAGHLVVRSALSSRPAGSTVVGPVERSVGRLLQILHAARHRVASTSGAPTDDGPADPELADGRIPWVIGGASYGGRVASMAVAAQGGVTLGVAGLLLVAYPLHPPGRPDRLRVAHWPSIDVPTLLLSGDADPFLTVELLDRHADGLGGPLTSLLIAGARHDLSVSARSAPDGQRRSPAEAIATQADAVVAWFAGLPEQASLGH